MKSLYLMQALSPVLHLKKALKCFNNSYFKQRIILFFPQAAEARPPLAQTLLSSLAVSTA